MKKYEYKIYTLNNEILGMKDNNLETYLNAQASFGWRVKSIVLNKTALAVVFEREIENLSVGRSLREEIQNATGYTEYGGVTEDNAVRTAKREDDSRP